MNLYKSKPLLTSQGRESDSYLLSMSTNLLLLVCQADLMRGVARQKEVGTYQQNASKYEDRMAGLTQDFKVKQTDAATKGKRHGRSLASVQTQMEATRTNQKLSRMAQEEMEAEQKGREAMERMEVSVWGGRKG